MEKEINCVYGSSHNESWLYVYDGWYVCDGSVNVNKASIDTDFVDGIDIELIEDIDCFTSCEPITSMEQLKKFIEEDE